MSHLEQYSVRKHPRYLPLAAVIASTLALSISSQACGPDFPNRLLSDRNNTLLYMPEGNYNFEVNRLIAVDSQLPLWKAPVTQQETAPLSVQQRVIQQMRATNSLEHALAIDAKNLSDADRLYTLGAVAFATHDIRAAGYFEQVLALPDTEQENWGLRAQYSLGRILMHDYPPSENGSDSAVVSHPEKAQLDQAIAVFQQVLDKVKNGVVDPDQLALSSLGQQARIHFWQQNIAQATELYAKQAAQGDTSGAISLRYVSNYLIKPDHIDALQQAIHDPLVQQLVTIELFTHSGRISLADGSDSEYTAKQVIEPILLLLNESVQSGFSGSDRLAAIAYRSGQYPLAASLLKHAGEGGLAWWLRAKMALRNGDVPAATAAYAKAAAAFPSNEKWGYQRNNGLASETIVPECRVAGEQAILALNRGDYLEAITLMYRGKENYWADVADIAERVLTIDELKGFVDKHVPAPSIPLRPIEQDQYYHSQITPEIQLRQLLARRLMRAGRYQEAMDYFAVPNYRQVAQEFTEQLKTAQNKTISKVKRAEAYYQAATHLYSQGLGFRAYEMTPDYAIYGAGYSYLGDSFDTTELKHKNWISVAEAQRAKKSLPESENMFLHYRWQAVALAQKAADLLPPKSENYAAVLCNAARWVIARDAQTGQALYNRYIKNGIPYNGSERFGYDCPAPEFMTIVE